MFNRIRFGTYYSDLIVPAGQTYGFHPLFVWSVVRQESLFEGFISSTAGARGLMQIIPATGRRYAASLGIRPFSTSRLVDPETNVLYVGSFTNPFVLALSDFAQYEALYPGCPLENRDIRQIVIGRRGEAPTLEARRERATAALEKLKVLADQAFDRLAFARDHSARRHGSFDDLRDHAAQLGLGERLEVIADGNPLIQLPDAADPATLIPPMPQPAPFRPIAAAELPSHAGLPAGL